ncbi:GntR family transcriptional regulator [Methylobrevis pamukkalensis]|uniref:HTH-type transcriptional repressor CsiR n=1 Tax=Methylobrevis pamukkalensis TaxID=1439726 RepID=A0A1E3H613_9HYPH|nr:GntR family transcriptional regulator [Methylobrevis pamukkalensis]ODN71236.1 HTH-type transcriptional repressor CsiR [Methylobrevis pamukkalensis]
MRGREEAGRDDAEIRGCRGEAARGPRRSADSASRAYQAIRRLVVEFRLKPEERINEVQLAQSLGLSRTPVREALNRLASEGFLVFTPNRGFVFKALEIEDLVRVFELRSIVETGSIALACKRASDAGIAELAAFWDEALERYRREDPDEILELDEAFHVRIAALSGNAEVVKALQSINARIRFVRRIQIERGAWHPRLVTEHTELVESLIARDAVRATEILRRHISMTIEDAALVLKEALFKLYVADSASVSQS